jgi:hypothetical protein
MKEHQQILQETYNSIIVALSETEVGKVIPPKTFHWVDVTTGERVDFLNKSPTLEDERVALQYANNVNDLMPKFIRMDTWQSEDGKEHEMMVLERLYSLPFNHFEGQIRELMAEVFALKLKLLHKSNFVHGDLIRPTNYYTRNDGDWMFGNVIQTEKGLRLVDAGFSRIYKKEIKEEFIHILIREEREIDAFKAFYLSY